MSEKKATLIKHVKSSNNEAEPTKPVEAAEKHNQHKIEKKKIIVKKKVVRVKPHAKSVEDDSKDSGSSIAPRKNIDNSSSSAESKKKIIKKAPANKGFSPLHAGPRIIKSTNLPPVPNQGKTAKDHAEWQSKNPVGSAEPKARTSAPRVAGTVGGRPVAGSRGRNNNYNRNNNNNNYNRNNSSNNNYNRNNTNYSGNNNYNRNGNSNYNGGNNNYNRNNSGNNNYNRNNNGNNNYNRNGNSNYNGGNNNYNRNNNNNNNNRGNFNNRNNGGPNNFRRNNNGPNNFNNRPRFGGQNNNNSAPSPTDFNKTKTKNKNYKKKNNSYQKRDAKQEKEFQIQRKREQVAAQLASVPKSISIMESITVADLAKKMNLKANDIIAKLFTMGSMVTINQQIDHETAEIIANEYNCKVNLVSLYDETLIESEEDTESDLEERAPIVTIMGHVDHGKTKLLDAIRSTNVAGGEFGGITQHIGAYKVSLKDDKGEVVFLDTPGHAAFTMMRSRGAQITDIVILVVAANDGVMPQTREAIDHAKAAKVPIIVAINKCDLPESNPERVMQQLSDLGLMPEEWGGQTLYCRISALKKEGIDDLLDTILLQSEMLELQANPCCRAEGKIIESRIDQGRGTVASVLIERGTLRQGDYYVAGIYPGRVRAMFDDTGKKIKEAGPSTPVEIIGLSNIPSAGDPFQVTEDEKQARQVGSKRQELERLGANKSANKFSLDTLFDKVKEGAIESLNVIIKGDVQGSVEALQSSLEKLSTSEIRLNVIRASAGAIIESDITLASASSALVIGFNVRPTPRASALAEQEKVEIRKYNIIYDVVDDVRDAMEGMLSPIVKEVEIGSVEVRDTFKVPKIGIIAGCYVLEGKVKRNSLVRVIRDNIQVSKSLIKLSSLKRFKDDAKDVAAGFECGIGLENFQDLKVGDILEVVEEEKVARKLEDGKKNESV
ncbi:MAG: translation initiation factor IF-2 [Pleomorphochaeta sp.]